MDIEEDGECYLICPRCGEMTTQTKVDENLSLGGSGDCYCEYMVKVWDSKRKEFEVDFDRIFVNYIKIPKVVWVGLQKEDNTVLRLRMLRTVSSEYSRLCR